MSSSSNGRHASGKALDLADATSAAERRRQAEARLQRTPWWRWGPYLSERQWGTVREDYSAGGTAWESFPHEHARSRTYRWGEDGLLGISDNRGRLCFAVALWNEADPILKERLFGLSGPEGNHGEDVKEYYFYLDSTPTHAYMRALYKYPQRAFPYSELVQENRRRGKGQPESVREGWHQGFARRHASRRNQPGQRGHQGGRPLHADPGTSRDRKGGVAAVAHSARRPAQRRHRHTGHPAGRSRRVFRQPTRL